MDLKNTLLDILTFRRPHNSNGEKAFIKKYMSRFEPIELQGEIVAYRYDNLKDSKNKILWSSHIDTVHDPKNKRIKQDVYLDSKANIIFIDEKKADCLGADDGAGVALMLSMIEHDVHGYYLFHRGEELGRIGSSKIAQFMTEHIATFTHAIAFDRRGTGSIITHQSMSRTCSDRLGDQLADLLGGSFKRDNTGSYTDTYSYYDLIPECTNISIGYDSEHSPRECLDLDHVISLSSAICSIDWAGIDLITDRDPSALDDYYRGDWWSSYSFGGYDLSIYDLESMNMTDRYHYLKSLDKLDLVNLIEDLLFEYDRGKYIE